MGKVKPQCSLRLPGVGLAVSTVLAGGFKPGYSVGGAWKLGGLPRFQVQEKDRAVAFSGPHSRPCPWQPEAAVLVSKRKTELQLPKEISIIRKNELLGGS